MLKVTIDITGTEDYREVDRIRIQADAIDLAEEWLYAVAGEVTLDIERVTQFSHSRIIGAVEGTFVSLVSPYMFEVLDNNVGEFKRIWTADINVTVTGH